MKENLKRLKEFKEWIERGAKEFSDVLGKESSIGHPFHQAAGEARRILKIVGEGKDGK